MPEDALAGRALAQRIVLLGLAHHARTGREPSHAGEVVRSFRGTLASADVDTCGHLGEATVSRALNRLESEGVVEMVDAGDTSPVGKGRPIFRLAVDADGVAADAREDDDLAPLVDRFAADWD